MLQLHRPLQNYTNIKDVTYLWDPTICVLPTGREPPQIEMYPEMKQTIVVGASALFQCHLTGGIPTPNVRWTRIDGQPITSNTEILSGGVLRWVLGG